MTLRHPLPMGALVISLHGEQDCNGEALPGRVGVIDGYQYIAGPQGHTYSVAFPLDIRNPDEDVDINDVVCVFLDQGDSIDDPTQYIVAPANESYDPEKVGLDRIDRYRRFTDIGSQVHADQAAGKVPETRPGWPLDPHGEHHVSLIEDAPSSYDRIYEVNQGNGLRSTWLGSEVEGFAAWYMHQEAPRVMGEAFGESDEEE